MVRCPGLLGLWELARVSDWASAEVQQDHTRPGTASFFRLGVSVPGTGHFHTRDTPVSAPCWQSSLLVGLSVRPHVPAEAVTSCPITLVLCRISGSQSLSPQYKSIGCQAVRLSPCPCPPHPQRNGPQGVSHVIQLP